MSNPKQFKIIAAQIKSIKCKRLRFRIWTRSLCKFGTVRNTGKLLRQHMKPLKRYVGHEFTECLSELAKYNNHLKASKHRATRLDFLHDGSFFQAIGSVLVLAQCFCLMPVHGVRATSVRELTFKWLSLRTWYSIAYMLATFLDTILTVNMVLQGTLDVRNIEPIIFHVNILFASIAFLRLARKWPTLMQQWSRVEQQMPAFQNWREREHLSKRIKNLTFVFGMVSLTEHLLSTISAIHFANYCPARKDPIESYFYTTISQIFFVFPYSAWLALLGKAHNVILTFGWSYMDIFVMNLGIGLSELLSRISRCIALHVQQPMSEKYWTSTRLQYRAVVELIANVDDAVSGIMMLCFANNLYFVCIQLLKSINKMPSVAHAIYFYFSLTFLLSRSLAVMLYVSAVNDRAREPLALFKLVPKHAYHEEIVRLANEIAKDEIALTGLQFFSVTRKLVLTVAGTILTYELVLIQFHEDQKLWHCGND